MSQQPSCVSLSVHPVRALIDQKLSIQVQNAKPGSKLTLHAFYINNNNNNNKWESFSHYVADSTGRVNFSEAASLSGTYTGVRPMGLMESLQTDYGVAFYKFLPELPLEMTISVYPGHQTEGFSDEGRLACVQVERWFMGPGVQRVLINEPNLTATLMLPPGPGPFPAVLNLWGGVEGAMTHRPALLASHGFAAMALDYTTTETTMKTGKFVDDTYFEVAYRALQEHPQIDSSRIAMMGVCVGASLTLRMAANSEVMKLSCAVSIGGTHLPPFNETAEKMIVFGKKAAHKITFNEKQEMILRGVYLPVPDDAKGKIDVGRLRCPLLVIAGEDDLNTPSYESALDMEAMMKKAGNSHLLTTLLYPKAGHLIDVAYMPYTGASHFCPIGWDTKILVAWGGEPAAHCLAEEDSWRKILDFLQKHLYET